jgi:NAD(P)H-dependent FMN reductase
MHLMIVCGSQKADSMTAVVGEYLAERAADAGFAATDLWDLGVEGVPFWGTSLFSDKPEDKAAWELWQRKKILVQSADALIVATPEWSGMVTPAIKNFLLLCGEAEVAHKPALPVAVSGARGGAYPISELRMSGYKNSKILWVPEQLIFREVQKNFEPVESEEKTYMEKRSAFALKTLASYSKALKPVRTGGGLVDPEFPNGM